MKTFDQEYEKYYCDFETVPIGGGNPYHCCKDCRVSVPEINGKLKKHHPTCAYRIRKEAELQNPVIKLFAIQRITLFKYILGLIRWPFPQKCIHSVALDILEIMEANKIPFPAELADSLCRASSGDEESEEILIKLIKEEGENSEPTS
jgi:hypothetical protein